MIPARAPLFLAVIVGLPAALSGCVREDPLTPPRVRFGDDVCAVCHMIVSDERFAAALGLRDDRDRVHKPVFDDIGCMFEHEAANPDMEVVARHIRHAETREWLNATTAVYAHSPDIHTPMGYGVAAYTTRSQAEAALAGKRGEVITFPEARRRVLSGEGVIAPVEPAMPEAPADPEAEALLTLEGGRQLRLTRRSPGALTHGKHPFELDAALRTSAGAAWEPASGLRFEITPWMPSMNHGSPGNEHPAHTGSGRHQGVVNLTMGGAWEVRVVVFDNDREIARHAFPIRAAR